MCTHMHTHVHTHACVSSLCEATCIQLFLPLLQTFSSFPLLSSPPILLPLLSPSSPPPLTASSRAFDEFGKISEQLEQETALRERAETMATEVSITFVCVFIKKPFTCKYGNWLCLVNVSSRFFLDGRMGVHPVSIGFYIVIKDKRWPCCVLHTVCLQLFGICVFRGFSRK